METLKNNLEIIGLVFSGVVAIVGYIKKAVVDPFKNYKKSVDEKLEKYSETLDTHTNVLKELKINGGKSIKDVINKIDIKLDNTTEKLNNLVAMVNASFEFEEDGIFLADKMGKCYYFNKAYLEMTGLTYNEALNYGWVNSVHSQDTEKVLKNWEHCVKTKSNITINHRYKNQKTKRVIKAQVSWQIQVSNENDETMLIFGRVKTLN